MGCDTTNFRRREYLDLSLFFFFFPNKISLVLCFSFFVLLLLCVEIDFDEICCHNMIAPFLFK